ncbi:MAG: NAD+ synthase [Acidobacteria bacterium]|nr:NAD+ synthase [Acidobacteriota bacterium]
MKIALAQMNPTVGDFSGNREKLVRYAREAQAAGADLAVFPELSLCGYPPRDLVEKPSFVERNQLELAALAAEVPGIAIIVGFVSRVPGESGRRVANSAALLSGGLVRFVQSKMLLPTYDVFDEGRYFEPSKKQKIIELGSERLALTICEDIWNDKNFTTNRLYPQDPVEQLFQQGATALVNISGSPFAMGKPRFREEMLRAFAVRYRAPVIFVNQVGGNDSLVFDGSSLALDRAGNVRARAKAFEEDLVYFDTAEGGPSSAATAPSESAGNLDDDPSVYAALVLGTRDYVRKCGFESVLIGLSGGIDSALTAAIAVDALGRDNVLGVAMPGPYSSPESLADARTLAANLGIRFEVVSITGTFEAYLASLRELFAGTPSGVAEENIQARVRGNLLMALSNKFRSLVLSTGNKSELSVGYCTLYGDMAGGLAVISDIPKTQVYRLCAIVNQRAQLIPPAIPQAIIDKAPTAELRPNQKDTDSLPPYEVLDIILKSYIEDAETARQIAERTGIALELVERVTRMVDGNEYKRQQAAPGLKVTSKAFGIGRRFPIAQRYRE